MTQHTAKRNFSFQEWMSTKYLSEIEICIYLARTGSQQPDTHIYIAYISTKIDQIHFDESILTRKIAQR